MATAEDVFRTRTIRRLNKSDRYNKELLESIVSTPWATKGVGKQPTDDFILLGTGSSIMSNKPNETKRTRLETIAEEQTKPEEVSDTTMKSAEDQVMHRDATMPSSSTSLQLPTIASSSTALAVPSTMSEKRGGSELSPTSVPTGKKTRTVIHTNFTSH